MDIALNLSSIFVDEDKFSGIFLSGQCYAGTSVCMFFCFPDDILFDHFVKFLLQITLDVNRTFMQRINDWLCVLSQE